MADERVVIRIDVDADTSDISRVQAQLASLAGSSEAADRSTSRTSASLDRMDGNSRRLSGSLGDNNNAFDQMDNRLMALSGGSGGGSIGRTNRQMNNMGNNARRSRRSMRHLMYAVIGVGLEFAIVAGSLSLVNAGFAVGRFAAKAYQGGLALAAGAAAGLTVALASVAAAQREWQAAVFATTYKSLPSLGNGTQQAMSALRMLTNDQRTAVFGMESLQQAFAGVSKNAEMTAPLKNALVGVGDFAVAAGGDIGKNFASAGEFIGLLQKEGKLTEGVLSAAGKVGPQFEKAVKDAQKAGISGAPELLAALSSGKLAEEAGIGGALGAVNNTLIGQLKGFMTEARSSFADFGQLFLPQLKATFKGISHELTGSFMRIQAAIGPTMGGSMITGLGEGIARLVEVLTRLFEDNLPKLEETFNSIYRFLKRTWAFLTSLDDIFRPFQEGSRIINQTFGPPIVALVMHFVDAFKQLNKLAVDNEDAFLDFGKMLERTVNLISDLFDTVKEIFVDNLDSITATMNTLLTVAEALLGVVKGLAAAGRGLGPVGSILSLGLGIGAISAFQAGKGGLNQLRGGPGRAGKRTIGGRLARGLRNPAMGGVALTGLAQIPVMGQAPQLASTIGMMGSAAAMGLSIQAGNMKKGPGSEKLGKAAGKLGLAAMSIPYLATALQSQTLLGGLATGAAGGAAAGGIFGAKGAGIGAIAGGAVGGIRGAVNQFDLSPQASAAIGAAVGLAAGAAIGGFFGGLPALIGAPIGAAVGALTGLVSGIMQDREQRDAVRKGFGEVGIQQAGGLAGDFIDKGLPGVEKAISKIRESTTALDQTADRYRNKTLGERKDLAEIEILQGKITQDQYDVLTIRNMDTGIKQLEKNSELLETQALSAYRAIDGNLSKLGSAANTSRDSIAKLAADMGLDLTDNTLDLSDALAQLGLAIPATTEEIRKSVKRISLSSMNDILKPIIEAEEAILAMDQAAEEVRMAGGVVGGRAGMAKFLTTVAGGAFAGQENPYSALANLEAGFGRTPGSGTLFTTPGSSLYGMDLGPEFNELSQTLVTGMRGDVYGDLGGRVATGLSALPGTDMMFEGADFSRLFTSLAEDVNIPPGVATKFAGAFTENITTQIADKGYRERFEAADDATKNRMTKELLASTILSTTGQGQFEGITPERLGATEVEVEGLGTFSQSLAGVTALTDTASQRIADEMSKMRNAVKEGFLAAFEESGKKPVWWDKVPDWWTAESPFNDTSSPVAQQQSAAAAQYKVSSSDMRNLGNYGGSGPNGDATTSRLARTMMSHSQLNSQLPGKRSVTSSWRDTNLGSLNSDHVTGNAYDLVGQNLVGYAAMVNGSGGFAEFHGSGGDRHLHVVPGAAPYGDAVSPMSSPGPSSAASYNSNYSIVVNASPNQDVSAIANEVMNRIEDKEREIRERS